MSLKSALLLSRQAMLGYVVLGVLTGSFAAQVPVLKAGIGADDAAFGLALLGSPLGLLITMWITPEFDRRVGGMAFPLAALFMVAAILLVALPTSVVGFFIAMVVFGLAAGTLDIVSNARVSELESQHASPLMNFNHGMFSVAYAASAIATGFAREAGFGPFTIFASLALLALALIPMMRMPTTSIPETERRAVKLPVGIVLLCGGIVLSAFFVEAVVESWSALHIERTLLGDPAEGASGPAVLGLMMALGRFSGQALSGRISEISIITYGMLMAAVGAALAAVAPTPLVAYLGFGLIGLGTSVVGPLGLALAGRMVPPAHRATAVARANGMGFAAFFLAPIVMGLVSDALGLRIAFWVVAAIALTGPLLAAQLKGRQGL